MEFIHNNYYGMEVIFFVWQYLYLFTQPLHYEQDVTQSQILSRVQLVWIPSFLSPRSVVIPKLKGLVCFEGGDNIWIHTLIYGQFL